MVAIAYASCLVPALYTYAASIRWGFLLCLRYSDDIRLAFVAWHSRDEDISGLEK